MPMDFTKKRPVRPPLTPAAENKRMEEYIRDLNLDGLSLLPGKSKPEEMVGVDPDHLRSQQEKNQELKERLLREMAATWQCTKCKLIVPGKNVRVRVMGGLWQDVDGVRTLVGGEEVLVCSRMNCDGPVVKIKEPYNRKLF